MSIQQHKRDVLDRLDETDYDEALKLVAQLKVCLLADEDGGLNKHNRSLAWRMVRDLGILLTARMGTKQ